MEFLVGDNVRRVSGWNGSPQVEGYEGVVTHIIDNRLYFADGSWGLAKNFELVFPTIEEGKFYRTRDGRKVGPMFRPDIGLRMAGHYWGAPEFDDVSDIIPRWYESGEYYKRDEESFSDRSFAFDLVAEWVEPVLTIEEGKYYRARSGEVLGPYGRPEHDVIKVGQDFDTARYVKGGGIYRLGPTRTDMPGDLVEGVPAPTGPVIEVTETVTRSQIVPGVHGGVEVRHAPAKGYVNIAIWRKGRSAEPVTMNADQLEAAAKVLTELAKAVRNA